jgi:hypothetical protein
MSNARPRGGLGLWASGLLSILLMAGMAAYLRDLEPSLLAAQFTFSRVSFEAVLSRWSPDQVARFAQHFKVDYLFLLVYGFFGWRFGRQRLFSHRSASKGRSVLPWLLPIAAAFDCLENMLHQSFLSQPQGDSQYVLAGMAASAKWALTLAFLALAVHAWRKSDG